MTTIELKPCPFCGGEAKNFSQSQFWIGCKDCGAEMPINKYKTEAIAAWNKRVTK